MHSLPTRRDLRLASGLVLFAYVSVHLLTHAAGLWSLDAAETGLAVAVRVWHSLPGSLVLYGAAATHIGLALWSIYERRTLRMPPIDFVRILLGLGTPLLLIGHVVATRYASDAYGLSPVYSRIVYNLFISDNEGRQLALLVPGWLHGCLGLWFAFKRHDWVMRLKLPLFAFAPLVPVLAGLGFVSMGREVEDLARDPRWVAIHAEVAPADVRVGLARIRDGILLAWLALIGAVFLAREIRDRVERRMDRVVTIAYPGRRVRVPRGWSVLEASRSHGIAHTSVCGGRARCSTCRVRVAKGLEHCAPPGEDEQRTLARIGAPDDVRLACQLRPAGDVTVVPLVAPEEAPRGLDEARERRLAILAATIVERVAGERAPLPHDRLYVMNRMAEAIGEAVLEAGGDVVEYTGEGVLATFDDGASALAAAQGIERRVDALAARLSRETGVEPVVHVGVHAGLVVSGEIGFRGSRSRAVVGRAVDDARRLPGLARDAGRRYAFTGAALGSDAEVSFADAVPATARTA
ncbi:MAG: 2Fe-2S iron-sulfur cluster-binding protein [Vicinamibacteria bacterium]